MSCQLLYLIHGNQYSQLRKKMRRDSKLDNKMEGRRRLMARKTEKSG